MHKNQSTGEEINFSTPLEKQLFYMQKAKQCDESYEVTTTCPDYLYLAQTEILEYTYAFINNDRVEMLDALADILVCVLGAVVKYKVVSKINEYTFNAEIVNFNAGVAHGEIVEYIAELQVCRNDINGINNKNYLKNCLLQDKLQYAGVYGINSINYENYLKNCLLPQIWNSAVYLAKENNFNIEGALHTVLDNNYARAKKDENENFVLQHEFLDNGGKNPNAFKVVKIKEFPKPNLTQFIL
jgi:hypothetical protein